MVKKMSYRGKTKILRIQAILFALFILLTISLPKSAIASPAYIYVYPTNQGPSGIWVGVNGWGFHSFTSVTIYFDGKIVRSTDTYGDGSIYYVWIQIPETSVGIHTITAKDTEGITASTAFTVTEPRMTLSPTSGPAGVEVTISGAGLGSYQMYTLKFDEIVLETPLFTDESGILPELTVKIPKSTIVGKHNFTLLYIGFYQRLGIGIQSRTPVYAPSTKLMVYATFEVTSGVATSYDVNALKASLEEVKNSLASLSEKVASISSDVNVLKENLRVLSEDVKSKFESLNARINDEVSRLNNAISTQALQFNAKISNLTAYVNGEILKIRIVLTNLTNRVGDEFSRLNEKIKDAGAFMTNIGVADAILAAIAIGLAVFTLIRKITKT
jgi:uncharacterized protein YoxC